ncbi:MAG: hypothetical protein N4A48_05205 [Tepidibacter sp.]|jgi:hypothetical protein|uniref:hypothetical protein n=1 Tax=Tepidibacter sp. TaxID=2529387 RepID=UPI0025CF5FEA|nr:hypothetical protein [Tepidibacter sp.]MCT4508151.1 hypothetical protein [Tepidibacter sp.]
MIKKVDKMDKITHFYENHIENSHQEVFINIEEDYIKNKDKIIENIQNTINKTCKEIYNLQQNEEKLPIKYIFISFLRTQILKNSSNYRVDFYDDRIFLDEDNCHCYFDMDFIFKPFFKKMDEIEKKKDNPMYMRQVTSIDVEDFKLYESLKYNLLVKEILKENMDTIFECEGFDLLEKDDELIVVFGEYKDNFEIIKKFALSEKSVAE